MARTFAPPLVWRCSPKPSQMQAGSIVQYSSASFSITSTGMPVFSAAHSTVMFVFT